MASPGRFSGTLRTRVFTTESVCLAKDALQRQGQKPVCLFDLHILDPVEPPYPYQTSLDAMGT